MTVYLDCAASTPVEPAVSEELVRYTVEQFGNAGSRTHEFGLAAKRRVNEAREQVAAVADATAQGVIFTSGATESNNLALLGLERHGRDSGRMHILSTAIEHKAVLEPLEVLAGRGFEVEHAQPREDGRVDPADLRDRIRPDTLLVSMMQANNETGVLQPVAEVADALTGHQAFFHVDAAQGFGKELDSLRHPNVDLISVSGHKLYAPQGVGALITRRRSGGKPPLEPLMYGGGQERGLRPGTLAVGPIAALGLACEIALRDHGRRELALREVGERLWSTLESLGAQPNGDIQRRLSTTVNVSIPGLDAEAALLALKGIAAASNGSACTSQSYEPSHVLQAMGLSPERISGALRFSWSHLTPSFDPSKLRSALARLAVPA